MLGKEHQRTVANVAIIVATISLIPSGIAFEIARSETNARIAAIQQSRLESCIRTYEGVRQVFEPFFPPRPRTMQEQDNLDKFNAIVDQLEKGCRKQTRPVT